MSPKKKKKKRSRHQGLYVFFFIKQWFILKIHYTFCIMWSVPVCELLLYSVYKNNTPIRVENCCVINCFNAWDGVCPLKWMLWRSDQRLKQGLLLAVQHGSFFPALVVPTEKHQVPISELITASGWIFLLYTLSLPWQIPRQAAFPPPDSQHMPAMVVINIHGKTHFLSSRSAPGPTSPIRGNQCRHTEGEGGRGVSWRGSGSGGGKRETAG